MNSSRTNPTSVLEAVPLNASERGMYLEQQLNPDSTFYNINIGIYIRGAEAERIREAVGQILLAHEAFHTAYALREGVPCRVFGQETPEVKTGGCVSREAFDEMAAEPGAPFDLDAEVPVRLTLYPLLEGGFALHLQIHHIAFDGGSLFPLMRELNQGLGGASVPAANPDLSSLSSRPEKTERQAEGLAFYREMFRDGIPSCDMPTKGPRPARRPLADAKLTRSLEPEEIAALTACARRHGVSVFETMLCAAAAALGKYCAAEDVVLGIPVNTRDEAARDVIGMFVNTAPVRVRPRRDLPLSDYLAATSRAARQATRHNSVPFETLVNEFCRERDESRNPIFDMGINYFHEPGPQREGGVETDFRVFPNNLPWDMCLNIWRRPEGIRFLFQYASELYDAEIMENFLDQFLEGLRRLAHGEPTLTGELAALPEKQLRQIEGFNQTEVPYENLDIVTLFRRQAKATPDRPAVVYGDRCYTYAQADEISDRIAARLRQAGIGREDVVSVLIPRCEYMALASLGVLKAGAVYQPLDPSYPPERLEFMISDARAGLLIADRGLLSRVPGYRGGVLCLDEIPALPAADAAGEGPKPEDGFVALYTSGSTGVPKGVVLEHRNLAHFCAWYRRYFDLTPESRVAAYASYGFDACMMDLYPALTTGARVCIIPEEIRLDFPALQRYFDENGITHSFMTTQVGRQFADFYSGHTLRHLFVGGETLAPLSMEGKTFAFHNGYGPTECTIFSTIFRVDGLYARVPIGRPLDNVRAYVVDQEMNLLPPGVPGELLIAGRGVGRGYLNRPEKTAEVFIPNPFTREEGYERVYRTGDVVRWMPDGRIDFLGRRDGQVKIRGFRIELSEVEAVIRDYPGIRDATVQAFDAASGGKYLAAYIVGDSPVDIPGLEAFIAQRKPPYMVPEAILQIEAIPLNQNQKVNRKALPVPAERTGTEEKEETGITDNVLEAELKEALREITGSENIPYHVPLSRAGLTSIGAIRLIAFVYKRYGAEITAEKLKGMSLLDLENEIISALIRKPEAGDGAPAAAPAKQPEPSQEQFEPYPLSAAQLGVYMDVVKQPESKLYNIPAWFEFEREVPAEKLKDAVARVVAAHPSLQVHFETIDGQVMAVQNGQREPDIPVRDMTEEQFEAFRSDSLVTFHPEKGPLYAFEIIRTESSVWLYADFHHLIFDGYSLNLFIGELKQALAGEEIRRGETDYSVFVREQQAFLAGEGRKAFEDYFADLFKKYESPSRITPDLPKSDQPGMAATANIPIDQPWVDEAVRRTGVSEAAFFLAVLSYVTARLTNSDDVYISTISSGRGDVRFSETYGMFVNTLPLASGLSGGTADEYIRKTAADLELAVAHENYPFAAFSDQWGYTVEIMYEYQRGIVADARIPGLKGITVGGELPPKFPVSVRIIDGGQGPVFEVEYDDSLYSPGLMEKICRYYRRALEQFARNGDAPLRGISLLDEKEAKLLADFHTVAEEAVVSDDTFFFTGMEKNAAAHPERTALIAADGTYTYREFDRITDRVANALIKRGAKAGERALILLPRTAKALFAFFGASKAGLGYIPFDPSYPTERVNLVIEDSGARFVITTADLLPRFEGRNAVDIDELLTETDETKPRAAISPQDISYMIYTSGSTGRPKGVMLTHGGMAHYVADMPGKEMVRTLVDECSVYICITTFSFDISVMEYSLALSSGLTLVLANEAECNDAELLAKKMTETKVDVISGTPSRIYTLLSSEAFCEALKQYGKLVICGGEKYSEKLMEKLKTLVPHPMNIYGPSEITISCNEHDLAGDELITVGRPTPGVTEYIVDTDGNELPIGVVGELYIGGWGVGLGYNNLDEMTKEKFIDFRGERVYKSGDYARWLENGYLEIIGRKDNQIKLRGLRIELGEVETVLGAQPGMKDVAVKIEKINGIEHLCAWFTNERQVDIRELKKEISRTLTQYMVPTAYMQLNRMPFTPNGKLDLKNLPVPEIFRGEGEAARTRAERDFCEIFSSLLGLENVLATENFFDLGGTSLLVTKVVIEAARYGYNIVFGDVFAHPTPRALAGIFEEGKAPEETHQDPETEDYDYGKIGEVLANNNLDSFMRGRREPLGHVLLTGATGYLGIHILHELLENTESKVTCLVRGATEKAARNRLFGLLFYYFDRNYQTLLGDRLFVVPGDVTDSVVFDSLAGSGIDTVINCAAVVKHFSHDTIIEDINVGGARNVIDFCVKNNARMIQTSTMSVVEIGYKNRIEPGFEPDERTLYFQQDLTNKYIRSKFLAERAVLEAVAEKGLRAKIFRYGNLAARFSDGEFQANFDSNSAMGNLRAYAALGCASYDHLDDTVEFSPIDATARASVLLAETPEECRLFHVISDQSIAMIRIFRAMNDMGLKVRFAEPAEFESVFRATQHDPEKAGLLTSLIAYNTGSGEEERILLPMNHAYTYQVLYRLGFVWPTLNEEYIRSFINTLKGLGYFDLSEEDGGR